MHIEHYKLNKPYKIIKICFDGKNIVVSVLSYYFRFVIK